MIISDFDKHTKKTLLKHMCCVSNPNVQGDETQKHFVECLLVRAARVEKSYSVDYQVDVFLQKWVAGSRLWSRLQTQYTPQKARNGLKQ